MSRRIMLLIAATSVFYPSPSLRPRMLEQGRMFRWLACRVSGTRNNGSFRAASVHGSAAMEDRGYARKARMVPVVPTPVGF